MHKKLAYYDLIEKQPLFPFGLWFSCWKPVQQLRIICQNSKEIVKPFSHPNHLFICFSEEQTQNDFDLT